ncbi:MAG: HD domain-containing protein [Candidatus Moranbacteria bacterium]|jgi:HD-GYP domain-containing protein (c-di-GMP phosphodiesterase class II)|nr:HD domain-containing protein [Candidatus Moranbacteria bacterium]
MTNSFEMPQQSRDKSFSHIKEEEHEFENLVLENCYNQGCEIISRDDFVRNSLISLKEHDKNTFIHSLEVGNMMAYLINEMADKFTEEEKRTLMMSALLHDFGKTHIDANILNKRETLTDKERKIIEEHPRHSFNALRDWDEEVARVAVAHHEHQAHSYPRKDFVKDVLDNRGKDGQIRKLSRILAIVDAFQAMTDMTRPSNIRNPKTMDQIIKELRERKIMPREDEEVLFLLETYYYQNKKKDEINYNNQSDLVGNA